MGIGKKGFTLVEIIVSLAIMTIVAGAVGAFVVAGNNSYMRGNKELTLQEEAQLTANQMIDLIIDVEKGISFSNLTDQEAVDVDGNVAKDVNRRTQSSSSARIPQRYSFPSIPLLTATSSPGRIRSTFLI